MSGILDILNSDIGKTLINGMSNQLGQSKQQTSLALGAALPLLLGAIKNNAHDSTAASGLMSALNSEKHDGSILNNLGNILGGKSFDSTNLNDGTAILGHIFNGKEENVARAVSSKSGVDTSSAMKILAIAAPIILGYLGKQKRQSNIKDSKGLEDLLGGLLGSSAKKDQSMVSKLLDADNDGSMIDDIIGIASGSKKSSGLGGLLGGFLGK